MLRAIHLRAAFKLSFDRTSDLDKAAKCPLVGHNTPARGEDLGAHRAIDPSRVLIIAAFDLATGVGLTPPGLVIWMCPSADTTQREKRYPTLV